MKRNTLNKTDTGQSVACNSAQIKTSPTCETKPDLETSQKLVTCSHSPQCYTRQPSPPPFGPLTLYQLELNDHIALSEKKENTLDKAYDDYEEKVSRKTLILVKKKIEQRLNDVEIDDEALAQLEKELLEDLEETIQEHLMAYRNPHSIP